MPLVVAGFDGLNYKPTRRKAMAADAFAIRRALLPQGRLCQLTYATSAEAERDSARRLGSPNPLFA
jgi:hypothetical protein